MPDSIDEMGFSPVSVSPKIACRALAVVPLALAFATAGTSVAMAQPAARTARPATALQTTAPACSNTRRIPGTTFGTTHCATKATGGTAPYSYQWAGAVNNNRALTSGTCTYGKDYVVSVTVTDATHTSVTQTSTNFCDPEGP
jgi:hypothetical protein